MCARLRPLGSCPSRPGGARAGDRRVSPMSIPIVHTETHPPELAEDDDGEDRPLLSVRLNVSELDDSWNSADVMLQEDAALDPDQVADAVLRCALAVAQLRGDGTLVALQQRLANWGQG